MEHILHPPYSYRLALILLHTGKDFLIPRLVGCTVKDDAVLAKLSGVVTTIDVSLSASAPLRLCVKN